MIGCASNHSQLAELFEDPRCEYRWLMNNGKDLITDRDFTVEQVRIDKEKNSYYRNKKQQSAAMKSGAAPNILRKK